MDDINRQSNYKLFANTIIYLRLFRYPLFINEYNYSTKIN